MSTIQRKIASRKTMVIGYDGLDLAWLEPLVASGELPAFATLMKRGMVGKLRSVTNMTTGPTWASFSTGVSPEQHRVIHDFYHLPNQYGLRPVNGDDLFGPTFWDVAGDHGKQVIVLNVPITYPVRPVKGVILAGIDAPSEHASAFCYPPDAYRRLDQHGIDYLIDCGLASYMQQGNVAAGIAAVERETEGRTQAAEFFMQELEWDLLTVVYSLPDVWQHYFWQSTSTKWKTDILIDGYRQIDRHLAKLLAYLPDDGLVIICSDHGFGPLTGTRDHLNQWLVKQGWLRFDQRRSHSWGQRIGGVFLSQIRQHMSFRTRQRILAAVPFIRRHVETNLRMGGIDWTETRAYAALDHLEVWINVERRQPAGSVKPKEYEAVCDQISADLLAWRDPTSDAPYVLSVERIGDVEQSDAPYLSPDLRLVWNEECVAPDLHPLITGDHAPEGTLIIAGPGVAPGRVDGAHLTDIAPLVLRGMGIPIPEFMTIDFAEQVITE